MSMMEAESRKNTVLYTPWQPLTMAIQIYYDFQVPRDHRLYPMSHLKQWLKFPGFEAQIEVKECAPEAQEYSHSLYNYTH